MSKPTTIDSNQLAGVTGGGEYTNDYGDLSGLGNPGAEKRNMTPPEHLNRFLYGGAMATGDRASLISNWEQTNGRTAPPRLEGTPQRDW